MLYYYVTNAQGDVVALLDTSGNVVVEYTYDAWGNDRGITGSMSNTLGQANPLRYRGYVYDQETGLYYLQSRYYDPEMGRFVNADAYASTGQDLTSCNMFAYCGNNPVVCVDISGEFFNTICGALVGGFISAFTRNDKKESFGQAFARGAVTGAIAGAALDISIATAGVGAFAIAAIGGAAAAGIDYVWEQHNKGEDVNGGDLAINIVVGGGMNTLFSAAGQEVARAVGNTVKTIGSAIVKNTIRSITNKAGNIVGKKVATEMTKNMASSIVQGGFSKIFGLVGSKMIKVFN